MTKRTPKPKRCVVCREWFTPPPQAPHKRYCDKSCRQEFQRQEAAKMRAAWRAARA